MTARLARKRTMKPVQPRVKLWLEADGESILCRGLSDMLKAVDETGSIKEAALQVGRSYRFVWSRIKEAERAFGATLVQTHVGGSGTQRSELSDLARDLISDFDTLRNEVFKLVDGVYAKKVAKTLKRHKARKS